MNPETDADSLPREEVAAFWAGLADGSGPDTFLPASWVEPPTEAPKETPSDFGNYLTLELLGAGGQGRVYRAYDPRLERWVALKLPHGPGGAHLEEARAQARIEHPHVCKVFEVGEVEGQPFIALQLVAGKTLAHRQPDLRTSVALVRDVAEGAHTAHRLGLLHLDIKPGNILVEERTPGQLHAYLADFGLAGPSRRTCSGTPPFCAPEQALGLPAPDRRADVYALGATLYALLAGRTPFDGTDSAGLLLKLQREEPTPLQVPRDLARIVAKAMTKDRALRYATSLALAEDLQRFLDGEPVEARPMGILARAGRRIWRHRLLSASLALAALALAALGIRELMARSQARQQQQFLQAFSDDIRTLETQLRLMRFLAPRDMRPHKAEIRATMARIRSAMEGMGPMASAGHYALGLGHRTLREHTEAATHLHRAWNLGFQTPESAEVTGHALGIQAGLENAKARLLAEPERTAKLAEIEARLGRRSVELLSAFEGRGATPYSRALLAYQRNEWAGVIAGCQATVKAQPWRMEAWRLMQMVAAAHPELAAPSGLALDAEGYNPAIRELQDTARGDSASYDTLAKHWTALAFKTEGERRKVLARKALAAYETAMVIDPEEALWVENHLKLCARLRQEARAQEWIPRARSVLARAEGEAGLQALVQNWRGRF